MKSIIIFVLIIIGVALIFFALKRVPVTDENQISNSEMLGGTSTLDIVTEQVTYFATTTGYYAHPQVNGNYPGVVMIHEWWGLNQNIKDMAETLAKEGYRVLAVDLFHGKVASTSDEARLQTSSLNQPEALKNLQAAVAFLNSKGSSQIASLGWCFGGGQSLQLSLSETPLDATVIYYGQLVTDQMKLSGVKGPVLGIFGDKDTSIPVAQVKSFEESLDNLKIQNEIHVYPGVGHAFANPTGMNYAPEATKDAWDKTLRFLNSNLKNTP